MALRADIESHPTRLQGHGGLSVLGAHVLIAPYGLSDPSSALAVVLQAVFFVMLTLVLVGVGAHRLQLTLCLALIAGGTLIRFVADADARELQAGADLALVACGALAMWLAMLRVFKANRASFRLITAAISLYVLSGITWSIAFHALELIEPGSFRVAEQAATASDLYYFSFVTLTTLGYGDVSPATPFARSLSTLEAVFGQVFLVVLLGRLVSLQIAHAGEWNTASAE